MLKDKRPFLGVLIGCLFLCGVLNVTPVFAEDIDIENERLSGTDRYKTSAAISKAGWPQANTVIIANGLGYADALAASSLSKSKDAPILLTQNGEMSPDIVDEIKRLKATKAILVGGNTSIGSGVENKLKSLNMGITRIGGTDRYDTSKKVAEAMDVNNGIIMATGSDFPDALSIAPIAGIKSMPILLSPKESMNSNVSEFIKSKSIPSSFIVGGTNAISESIAEKLPKSTRLGGDNRYATNLNINKTFEEDLNFDTVYLATGNDFPDALAGSALAAKNNSPIFLSGKDSIDSETIDFIKSKNVKNVVVLGGSSVVSDNVLNDTAQNITAQNITVNNEKGDVDNNILENDLNVRAAPSTDSEILGNLYNYEKIKILDTVKDTGANAPDDATEWYKILYKDSYAYIQRYNSPPDDVVDIAKGISKQYEVQNSTQIAGNADKQGISLGYLQWNIGQGTLQPILNKMDTQYNEKMKTIFGTNYDIIHEMITNDTLEEQLTWAQSINNSNSEVIKPWKSQFNALSNTEEFKSIEADAEVHIVKQAMIICDKYKLRTTRGFALAYDIVLQNGSLSEEAIEDMDSARNQNPNMNEKDFLGVIANAVADSSTRNSEDVRSRKMAIVNGQGTVHGIILDLDKDYMLNDDCFR